MAHDICLSAWRSRRSVRAHYHTNMRLLSQSDPDEWDEELRRHARSMVIAERGFDTSPNRRASGPGTIVATGGSPVCAAGNP
eukprot:2840860-Pyramimonas_sp.AAC.1